MSEHVYKKVRSRPSAPAAPASARPTGRRTVVVADLRLGLRRLQDQGDPLAPRVRRPAATGTASGPISPSPMRAWRSGCSPWGTGCRSGGRSWAARPSPPPTRPAIPVSRSEDGDVVAGAEQVARVQTVPRPRPQRRRHPRPGSSPPPPPSAPPWPRARRVLHPQPGLRCPPPPARPRSPRSHAPAPAPRRPCPRYRDGSRRPGADHARPLQLLRQPAVRTRPASPDPGSPCSARTPRAPPRSPGIPVSSSAAPEPLHPLLADPRLVAVELGDGREHLDRVQPAARARRTAMSMPPLLMVWEPKIWAMGSAGVG
jgi:hypothetical protein